MGEQPASNHRSRFLPQVPLLDVLGDMQLKRCCLRVPVQSYQGNVRNSFLLKSFEQKVFGRVKST